jgi:transcriptional regulator with XRE-family HTH domain
MLKDRIRELRLSRNLTQEDFANILGVSRPAITKYETGEREPDYQTLIKISDYFGVSLDYLFGRKTQTAINQEKLIKKLNIYEKFVDALISEKIIEHKEDLSNDTMNEVTSVLKLALKIAKHNL